MARKRNRFISILTRTALCIIVLGAAVAIYSALYRSRPEPARTNHSDGGPRVMVMVTHAVDVRRQWDGFGTARALDSADVPARVVSTVVRIPPAIQDGARVETGDLLVQLDDSDFAREVELMNQRIVDINSQLERMDIEVTSWTERTRLAEERVRLARTEYQRVVDAEKQGAARPREVDIAQQALVAASRDMVASREELDKIAPRRGSLEAQRNGLEVERRLARQRVDRCRIESPIPGVIESVDVEVGENLTVGQRVARVVDLSHLEVPLRLPAGARASTRLGDEVRLSVNDESGRVWPARVIRIAPVDDESTRTMGVYIEIEQDADQPGGLAPGQFLRGTVTAGLAERRSIVPRRALDGNRILVISGRGGGAELGGKRGAELGAAEGEGDGGTIEVRAITADFQIEQEFPSLSVPDRQWVVLRDRIADGTLVVLNPSRSLPDGIRVEPIIAGNAGNAGGKGGSNDRGGS